MKQRITPHRGRWAAASLPFIVLGALAAWLALQSMASLQALGNRLAPDGSLEILGLIPEQTIRLAMALAAMILLGLGGVMLLRPGWLIELVHFKIRLIRRIPGDFKAFWVDLRGWPHLRRDGWILLAIMAASLLIRAPLLDRPMFHDESYTAVTWAPGPLTYILEDYHLPNNHIFHTILVSWSHDLFGSQPWSVRLPAFIAALLLIPAGYGLTRRWYGRVPALSAAALMGIAPIITDYATNARGYSLFMLFSLLIFWLAARLARQNNLVEWLLLVVFASLGFWTVPMMLYPFGAVCVWLGLSAVFDSRAKEAYGGSLQLILYVVVMGISAFLLTGLMYLPVMLDSGTRLLFHNPFIEPLSFLEFWPTLFESRLPETYAEWTRGLGVVGAAAVTAGVFLSLIFYRRISRYPIHPLWAILLWIVPMLLLRRPNAWARTWSFLYPLGYILTAAGWVGLVDWLKYIAANWKPRLWAAQIAVVLLAAAGLWLSFDHSRQICPAVPCPPGDEEQTVLFLQHRLQPTDLILVQSPSNAVMWYYFDQYGLSRDHFRRDLPFYRAYLLVRPTDDQSVAGVIEGFGFSDAWFELPTLSLEHTAGPIQTYQVEANRERVDMEYGIK